MHGEKSGSTQSYSEFCKRTCNQFVPSKKDHKICGCGLSDVEHNLKLCEPYPTPGTWDPNNDTVLEPTDAYGQLEFSGAGQTSRAKYIRIEHNTDAAKVLDFMINEWKLKLPKLLISVTGGAKDFILHPKLKQILRQGLLKAARTTGAWIFTGGTNTGVMKHVGEAVRGQTVTSLSTMDDFEQLQLIGIATWGIVQHRETLVDNKDTVTYFMTSSTKSGGACLDNNHTHFILVDNGTNGKYEGEIAFRAALEKEISNRKISEDKRFGIPVVLLVMEGGPNTIKTVLESVNGKPPVPVVITEGTGRAADIIAFAHRIVDDDGSEITTFSDAVEHQQLKEKIKQAYPGCNETQLLEMYNNILKCVRKKKYITIFRINKEGVDIDRAILRALLKDQHASRVDQLSLALVWNRVDFAMSEIFVDNQEWKIEDLESVMMDALSNDCVEFVRLLQENSVSIEHFLTKNRLLELYEKRSKVSDTFKHIIGKDKLQSGFNLDNINAIINRMLGGKRKEKLNVEMGLKRGAIGMLRLPGRHSMTSIDLFYNPFNELFLWAVLCNMQKMALFMWERGDNNLALALIGARMYMEMARKLENESDVYDKVIGHAQEFKKLAIELLDECYRANESTAQKLLTYNLEDWCGHTCLLLAVALKHEEFVAHASCQSMMSKIWVGKARNVSMWKIILGIFVPPTICCLEFKTKKELSLLPVTREEHQQEIQVDWDSGCGGEDEEEQVTEQTRVVCHGANVQLRRGKYTKASVRNRGLTTHWGKFKEFHCTPITKFWFNVIAYMMFLVLFSYVILIHDHGYPFEVVLIVYVCSLCIEEIRQIIQSDKSVSGIKRIKVWASSKWNICDGVAVLLFFVGLGLRPHSKTADIGHVVYCLDIMLWIIRLLDIFSVSKNLGPYVVMIGRMTIDMLYFLMIMVVFLLAYGVAQQAILFPKQKATWSIIPMIFFRPYFQIYGELFITDPLHVDDSRTEFSTPKHNLYGGIIASIIMAFYVLVVTILLLNLLIAIFNHIFSEVQAHSNQIWKFQRYELIMEYAQRPPFVPPLNILYHSFNWFVCFWKKVCCCCFKKKGKASSVELESQPDNRLKLFLKKEDLEELLLFEEHCLYSYLHKKHVLFNDSTEERVRVIANRVELISSRLEEMAQEKLKSNTTSTLSTVVTSLSPKKSRPESKLFKKSGDKPKCAGHVFSTRTPYPMSNVERYPLTDSQVDWNEPIQGYNPPWYTAANILRGKRSADPDLQSGSTEAVMLSFNKFDGNINRQSYVGGLYDVIQGLPRNPVGRTGLAGRGLLEHWGPNHVDLHIITRWRRTDGGVEVHDKERLLEFVAVTSRDNYQWKLPESKSTIDKVFSDAFKENFCKAFLSNSEKTKRKMKLQPERLFLETGLEVFRGYVDDERNTDNAWIEAMVTNYHDKTGEFLGNLEFRAESGTHSMTWLGVSSQLNLPENDLNFLKKVVKLHK